MAQLSWSGRRGILLMNHVLTCTVTHAHVRTHDSGVVVGPHVGNPQRNCASQVCGVMVCDLSMGNHSSIIWVGQYTLMYICMNLTHHVAEWYSVPHCDTSLMGYFPNAMHFNV